MCSGLVVSTCLWMAIENRTSPARFHLIGMDEISIILMLKYLRFLFLFLLLKRIKYLGLNILFVQSVILFIE